MKTLFLAAAAALSLSMGVAYAGDGDDAARATGLPRMIGIRSLR